ncbi:glycosyltransferase family 2 protein [Pseudorhodobacter sp. MZDSW-24AT]|uniref:glycosyltransferase family 2 protein n=1 Tax=Pseudorhodobacter sp. MZDSW-24AT TaxID=2052957 RepID=UPI000C1F5D3E|nr:glycosyltransferase family 2 protein [Pseudorhodobacter sp. MZDSW-24AT]PJF10038.1 glycosyl transferase family 2 [Pseudorhodobacter sp. MZDSW-24AT]
MAGLAHRLLALLSAAGRAYGLRTRRRRHLWRAFRSRRKVQAVKDRSGTIRPRDILCFMAVRNEMLRLPHFLDHHRSLGVDHFLIVDNDSTDGTRDFLAAQPDVSLWHTPSSYKQARFGLDWVTWLQIRHGHGHWTLTLDADELLIYPYWQTRPLPALTAWLDDQGLAAMGAMMLDLYPEGPLSAAEIASGGNPLSVLRWFDAGNYGVQLQPRMGNLWIQGGPRARMFFAKDPRRAPSLNKIPLVRWNRRFAYANSTHALLPPRLNRVYATDGSEQISGLLLHTKFLPEIIAKSAEEKARKEHFANSALYDDYYDSVTRDPVLWCPESEALGSWRRLEALGLMSRGGWI